MRSVLIVDDDPRVRAALAALLAETSDLQPTAEAASAGEAYAVLAARPVDIVVADVLLPTREDGIALIETLSASHHVLALSIDGSSREPALAAGAVDYLEKDGSPEEILRALRKIPL